MGLDWLLFEGHSSFLHSYATVRISVLSYFVFRLTGYWLFILDSLYTIFDVLLSDNELFPKHEQHSRFVLPSAYLKVIMFLQFSQKNTTILWCYTKNNHFLFLT